MKKYSLKINGNPYEVKIEDINESSTMARVTVNGTKYDVEIEGGKAAAPKKPQVAAVPQAATSISVTPQTPIATKPAATVAATSPFIRKHSMMYASRPAGTRVTVTLPYCSLYAVLTSATTPVIVVFSIDSPFAKA